MKKIGPKGSVQELFVQDILTSLGFRFRLHSEKLPGKPDITLPKYKKVIFVNGCFWHGHKNCKRSKLPTTNVTFWKKKIAGNVRRDKEVERQLKKLGWSYLKVWQCQIGKSKENRLKARIDRFLHES